MKVSDRSLHCNLCDIKVHFGKQKYHIRLSHLKQALYNCSECSFSDNSAKSRVAKHIRQQHGKKGEVIEAELEGEYAEWIEKCFPQSESKKLPFCRICEAKITIQKNTHIRRTHMGELLHSCNSCEYSTTVSIVRVKNHIKAKHKGKAKVFTTESQEELREWSRKCFGEEDLPKIVEKKPLSKNACKLCQMDVPNKRDHIYIFHIKKSLFTCPNCKYSSTNDKENVVKHISRQHGGLGSVVSSEEKLQKEFDEWKIKCFGEGRLIEPGIFPCEYRNGIVFVKKNDNKTFFCKECDEEIKWEKGPISHVKKIHQSAARYLCSECPSSCVNKQFLRFHIKSFHDNQAGIRAKTEEDYANEEEDWVNRCFGDSNLIEKKVSIESNEEKKPFAVESVVHFCLICNKDAGINARSHVRNVHLKKKFNLCPHCDYGSYTNISLVRTHIKNKHRGKGEVNKLPRDTYLDEENELMRKCFMIKPDIPLTLGSKAVCFNIKMELEDNDSPPEEKYSTLIKFEDKLEQNSDGSYCCRVCKKNVKGYRDHALLTHYNWNRLQCSLCDYQARLPAALKKHQKSNHKGKGSEIRREINPLVKDFWLNLCFGDGDLDAAIPDELKVVERSSKIGKFFSKRKGRKMVGRRVKTEDISFEMIEPKKEVVEENE